MYRIVFLSRDCKFLVVKDNQGSEYYIHDRVRMAGRFEHWAQCESLLMKAYEERSAKESVFTKRPTEDGADLLHEILGCAYGSGLHEFPLTDFDSLENIWRWYYEEKGRYLRGKSPESSSRSFAVTDLLLLLDRII